ncbi:hypothetical protein AMTRI_Chr09g19610 [Amborella trichopoda]
MNLFITFLFHVIDLENRIDMNLDTRYTIDLDMKANTPIEDYPIEVDYDLGGCNKMEDIIDFDSDGDNKFDVCQDTEDANETNMDEPQGFEFSDNVPKEDFKSHNETLVIKTASRMVKQMVEIYTPTIFSNFFQPKLMEAINLTCEVQEEDKLVCTFSLKEYGICRKAHVVAFRNTEEKETCSCHLYERMDIPCSYMLKVFFLKNILDVGLYEYAKMVIDDACDKVAARIDMAKASAIQASSTHCSSAYTGSPFVTSIPSVASNPHMIIKAPIYAKPKGWPSPLSLKLAC